LNPSRIDNRAVFSRDDESEGADAESRALGTLAVDLDEARIGRGERVAVARQVYSGRVLARAENLAVQLNLNVSQTVDEAVRKGHVLRAGDRSVFVNEQQRRKAPVDAS